jgi:metallo-beta-lactamase class B
MQIFKNLYQVGGDVNGLTFVGEDAGFNDGNSYILKSDDGLIMFDCGCGDTLDQIVENMAHWDLSIDDVKYCLLTHPHLDHAGAAHLLKNRGVTLISGAETADAVASGDERCCGYLYHKEFQPCQVDQIIEDHQTFEVLDIDFKSMLFPGHTQACTAYFFELHGKKFVVSGDVIGTLLVGDFGWDGSIDFDKRVYIESLRHFAKIDTDVMLPGHGLIYFHNPRRRVEQTLNEALIQWR